MDKIKIVIIENDNVARVGAEYILSQKGMFHIVGVAKNCKDGLAEIESKKPEVVLVNTELPDSSGGKIISLIKKACAVTRIVAMGAIKNLGTIKQIIDDGADCYYCKLSPEEYIENHLIDAVIAANRNGAWIDSTVNRMLIDERQSKEKDLVCKFTDREISTLKLIANGMSNEEIAKELNFSNGTIRSYIHTLFDKLNVGNRINAIRYGIYLDIISISDFRLEKGKIATIQKKRKRKKTKNSSHSKSVVNSQ
ncbi:MAG: response regulator transcription factor [Scytonematopsis contorta HA4267-MV1]|jgi:DNA-binding NarL/FixJ family response regulator|nr:response regulator transcription factor [Scytonematopsis contorta HA4267-MV1]